MTVEGVKVMRVGRKKENSDVLPSSATPSATVMDEATTTSMIESAITISSVSPIGSHRSASTDKSEITTYETIAIGEQWEKSNHSFGSTKTAKSRASRASAGKSPTNKSAKEKKGGSFKSLLRRMRGSSEKSKKTKRKPKNKGKSSLEGVGQNSTMSQSMMSEPTSQIGDGQSTMGQSMVGQSMTGSLMQGPDGTPQSVVLEPVDFSQKNGRGVQPAAPPPAARTPPKAVGTQDNADNSQKSGRSPTLKRPPDSSYSEKKHPGRNVRGRSQEKESDSVKSGKTAKIRSTPVTIKQSPVLTEQDERFEKLRKAPEDEKTEWNRRFPAGSIVIYTDGYVVNHRQSGFGIYYGPNHELNRGEKINHAPHNISRSEVLAAIYGLRNLREWKDYKSEPVIVRTDAWMIIKEFNGEKGPAWFNEAKSECLSELKELREEIDNFPNGITFQHVHPNAGPDPDPGNEAAEELARQATARPQRSHLVVKDRSTEPGRIKSLTNDPDHIKSHTAQVTGEKKPE